ncbi:hypothetical protein MKY88_11940 [Lysinibacillus sp. FSL R7-0073]|uniref:hypothetical protein n=1 Tax=Lysinibacillus TaxID=400634 RepID=UPI002E1D4373|nr:hypothetical protein [Lysinibacillus fusiformis]
MINFASVESGHITSKIVRFVVESYGKEVLHVYEVQFAFYPGANNEIIYSGGFRQINVAEQGAVELHQLEAKNEEDALLEVTEKIKDSRGYVYV